MASEDGVATFHKAVVVSDWYSRFCCEVNGMPSLAADETTGPSRDRLYAAWPDVRMGRGEIRFAYSSDKGMTWSKSVVISDDLPRGAPGLGPDNFMPVLAVNRNGVVGATWYDSRDHADGLGWSVRFSASFDGGETFLPSVRPAAARRSKERRCPSIRTRSPPAIR